MKDFLRLTRKTYLSVFKDFFSEKKTSNAVARSYLTKIIISFPFRLVFPICLFSLFSQEFLYLSTVGFTGAEFWGTSFKSSWLRWRSNSLKTPAVHWAVKLPDSTLKSLTGYRVTTHQKDKAEKKEKGKKKSINLHNWWGLIVIKIRESRNKYTYPVKLALITFDIPANISVSTVTVRKHSGR